MLETNIIITACSLAGAGALIGGIKGIDWLISQKYQTKVCCKDCNTAVLQKMNENKTIVTENINKQYKEIIDKIERQTEIFQGLAQSVAEISAENKIILHNLGLKK